MKWHLRLRLAPLAAALLLVAVILPATAGRAAAATVYTGYKLPYAGGSSTRVTQGWCGTFSHGGTADCYYAYDFGLPAGTPVVAAMDGKVLEVKTGNTLGGCSSAYKNYANYVKIEHPNGTQTWYWHLQSAVVAKDKTVVSGQLIGFVGNTGWSCGAHLHYQVGVDHGLVAYFDEYPGTQLVAGGHCASPAKYCYTSQNYQTGLKATRTTDLVYLSWANTATDSPKFVVQRSTTSASSGWATVATLSTSARTYTDSCSHYITCWYQVGAQTSVTLWSRVAVAPAL